MTLRDIQREAWACAHDKGFHADQPMDRTHTLLRLCLIHTEISEAAQAVKRHGIPAPGLGEELADACIRIFDLAEGLGIDLEEAIAQKMRVNRVRPVRYGTPWEGKAL